VQARLSQLVIEPAEARHHHLLAILDLDGDEAQEQPEGGIEPRPSTIPRIIIASTRISVPP
jgi:hypothetical protein